jgi:hypothetical protein
MSVFLNKDEFADIHSIYGVDISCVVDEDTLRKATQYLAVDAYTEYVMLYVNRDALEEINRIPVEGNEFRLDGKRYRVMTVSEVMGMLEVALERLESL